MFKPRRTLILLFVGFLVGCGCFPIDSAELAPLLPGAPTVGDVSSDNILDPNTPALDSPAANAAPIRVRLSNPTERDADCQVNMELIGREVHFSLRRILAATQSLVIGPDRADVVRIEAVFLGQPPAAMEPLVLRLGQDFNPGETIEFVLALPTDGSEQEIPPAPTIAIEGLDQDVVVNPGDLVTFDVVTANASAQARIAVFADPDADLDNDNELAILDDAPAGDRSTIVWNTTAVPPGTYTVLAELRDADDVISAEPAPGQVIIVAPPPTGACCVEGECLATNLEDECAELEGEWFEGETCPEFECPGPCPADPLEIRIFTDNSPSQTTWELYVQDGPLVAAGTRLDDSATLYSWEVCLEDELCYDFIIYDSSGDGICCAYGEGYYELHLNAVLVGSGGEFTESETTPVGNGCAELTGACWFHGDDGIACLILPEQECLDRGGTYHGDGADCPLTPSER